MAPTQSISNHQESQKTIQSFIGMSMEVNHIHPREHGLGYDNRDRWVIQYCSWMDLQSTTDLKHSRWTWVYASEGLRSFALHIHWTSFSRSQVWPSMFLNSDPWCDFKIGSHPQMHVAKDGCFHLTPAYLSSFLCHTTCYPLTRYIQTNTNTLSLMRPWALVPEIVKCRKKFTGKLTIFHTVQEAISGSPFTHTTGILISDWYQ